MAEILDLRTAIRAAVVVVAALFAGFHDGGTARAQSCYFNAANDFICPDSGAGTPATTKNPAVNPFAPATGGSLYNSGTGPYTSFPDAPPSTIVPLTPEELIALQDAALAAIQKALEDAIAKAVEEAEKLEAANGVTVVCEPTGNSITKFSSGFDDCSISGLNCSGNCPTVGNSGGNCNANFTLTPDMPTNYRTEAVLGAAGKFDWGIDYWVNYDFNLVDWQSDSVAESVMQIHLAYEDWSNNVPGPDPCGIGNGFSGDPIMLFVQNDMLSVVTFGGNVQSTIPVKKDQWQHMQFHYKPSAGADGVIEVWIDGVLLASVPGPNSPTVDKCGNAMAPPYLKLGTYKWDWKRKIGDVTSRQILVDNVSVIEGEAICTPIE